MSDITIEAHRAAVEVQAHLRELNGHLPNCKYPGTDCLTRIILAAFTLAQAGQPPVKLKPVERYLIVGSQRSYNELMARLSMWTRTERLYDRITCASEVDGLQPAENISVFFCRDANLVAVHELRRRGFNILPPFE